jgi:hypothetical protein
MAPDWAAAAKGESARAETRAAKIGREMRLIYFLPSYGFELMRCMVVDLPALEGCRPGLPMQIRRRLATTLSRPISVCDCKSAAIIGVFRLCGLQL